MYQIVLQPDKIREYEKTGLSLEESVKGAVLYCIEKNILKDFLREHGSEVVTMMVEEYTTEDFLEAMMEEAREEEKEQVARNSLAEGLPVEVIHKITGLSTETIQSL